ncbi:hypothetical protein GCM10027073_29600 [Streptomyces chlorus]
MDRLKGSELHRLKELRPGSGGRSEIRIVFGFTPTRAALLLLGGDKAGNRGRWYRDNIPLAERLYHEYTSGEDEGVVLPKKAAQDWDVLEQELYEAGVEPAEVEAGSRRLLAEARGRQLAEARKQSGLAQRGSGDPDGIRGRQDFLDRARCGGHAGRHRPLRGGARRPAPGSVGSGSGWMGAEEAGPSVRQRKGLHPFVERYLMQGCICFVYCE